MLHKISAAKSMFALLFAVCGLFLCNSLSAQSTVYFFISSLGSNTTFDAKLNGEKIFDLEDEDRPIVKTIKADAYNEFQEDWIIYSACYKKCQFFREGKCVFSIEIVGKNLSNGKKTRLAAELQLNLSEGSVHYVHATNKGMFDCQLKEITQKEAEKLLKGKKKYKTYVPVSEYVEEAPETNGQEL